MNGSTLNLSYSGNGINLVRQTKNKQQICVMLLNPYSTNQHFLNLSQCKGRGGSKIKCNRATFRFFAVPIPSNVAFERLFPSSYDSVRLLSEDVFSCNTLFGKGILVRFIFGCHK